MYSHLDKSDTKEVELQQPSGNAWFSVFGSRSRTVPPSDVLTIFLATMLICIAVPIGIMHAIYLRQSQTHTRTKRLAHNDHLLVILHASSTEEVLNWSILYTAGTSAPNTM